jgi:hypothetical protein
MKNYRKLTEQQVLKRYSLNLFIKHLMTNADILCQQPKRINFSLNFFCSFLSFFHPCIPEMREGKQEEESKGKDRMGGKHGK